MKGKRLKLLIKALGVSQKNFADEIGLPASSITRMVNEEYDITKTHALAIKSIYPTLNIDWLLTGEGEMFLSKGKNVVYGNNSGIVGDNNTVNYNLSQGEAELVDAVREKDSKKLLKLIAKFLSVFSLIVTGIIYLKCGWV